MSEIEHLDILTTALDSVTLHRLGLGGGYEWAVYGLTGTDLPVGEVKGLRVRTHKGHAGRTLHVSSGGATRAEALAGAADLWTRHAELLAASEGEASA